MLPRQSAASIKRQRTSGGGIGDRVGGWIPVASSYTRSYPHGHYHHAEPSLIGMHFFTAALRALQPRIDDDLIDRLNYYYSSTMIIMFAILVSAKQYVGHPIECWVPAQFTKAMEQYAENYCWIQNTYWVPFSDLIPNRPEERERRQIGYYQWVPFILILEALMFYIPALVWRLLNTQSGINTVGILQMASSEQNMDPENRLRTVYILSRHLDDALRYQRDFGNKDKTVYLWAFVRLGKFYGAYVSLLHIFVKFLYFANALGQFFLLNRFLETSDYPLFGAHVLHDLLSGTTWQHSGKFPRVTLCDFDIRVVGNIHRHTVQCVLVINLFTEKIFICLWLWLLFLCFTDFFGLLFWSIAAVLPSLRIKFILKHLDLSDSPPDHYKDAAHIKKFVLRFLRPDGVLMLRMISNHGGNILCAELVYSLWLRYKETYKLTVEVGDEEDEDEDGVSSLAPSHLIDKRSMMTGLATGSEKLNDKEPLDEDSPKTPLTSVVFAADVAEMEPELEPWAKPPPPFPHSTGNHRPAYSSGHFSKGRFIPERPNNHVGSSRTVTSAPHTGYQSPRTEMEIGSEKMGSAYV